MAQLLRFANSDAYAAADWYETISAHVLKVDVPGINKKDVLVHVHDDSVLEVSGEFKNVEEKGPVVWHVIERRHGRFVQQFQLPENVKLGEVKAVIEAGVLTVTIPKKLQVKSTGRNVPIVSKL